MQIKLVFSLGGAECLLDLVIHLITPEKELHNNTNIMQNYAILILAY